MSEFCIIGNKYCDDAVNKQKRVRPYSSKTEDQLFCGVLLKDGIEVKGVEARINHMSACPSKKKGVLWCGKSQSKKKT